MQHTVNFSIRMLNRIRTEKELKEGGSGGRIQPCDAKVRKRLYRQTDRLIDKEIKPYRGGESKDKRERQQKTDRKI